MLNQKEVKTDYTQLISLWRSSVEATHLFLSQADIDKIEVVLPDYFQQVQLSMWLNEEQKCVGFSGTNQQTLEMLFIDPVYFRKGYGGEIIQKLIEQESIIFVDANKQNEGAVKFYQSQGFQVIGESKEDPQKSVSYFTYETDIEKKGEAMRVIVTEYQPAWVEQFEEEAQALKQILKENCLKVEHIGSTSVPNLAAKPIIDFWSLLKKLKK